MLGFRNRKLQNLWIQLVVLLVLGMLIVYGVYMTVFAVLYYGYTHNVPASVEYSNSAILNQHDLKKIHEYVQDGNVAPGITVVSAYFRLGKIYKGTFNVYTSNMYMAWMGVFERMKVPIVFFTDDQRVFDFMTHLRRHFPKNDSNIILIKRTDLWAFSILKKVKTIFEDPSFPKFNPDTVHSEYSCVMHAKAELVNMVVKRQMYKTKYISWLDVGLFRHDVNENHNFSLHLPPGWDKNKILYSQVFELNKGLSESDVFRTCDIWVSGAIFLGRPEVMYIYTQEYMRAVELYLSKGLMASDQQVVYAMYIPKSSFKPKVKVQPFPTHRFRDFYHLGYVMKDISDTTLRSQLPLSKFMQAVL